MEEFDVRFPYICVWIEGFFATIFDNGDIEFYNDCADIRMPLKILRQFLFKADRFMLARERVKSDG